MSDEKCGATTLFWPGDEDIYVVCELEAGHQGDHADDAGFEWSDDD